MNFQPYFNPNFEMIKNYTEFLIENIKWWDSESNQAGWLLEEE